MKLKIADFLPTRTQAILFFIIVILFGGVSWNTYFPLDQIGRYLTIRMGLMALVWAAGVMMMVAAALAVCLFIMGALLWVWNSGSNQLRHALTWLVISIALKVALELSTPFLQPIFMSYP